MSKSENKRRNRDKLQALLKLRPEGEYPLPMCSCLRCGDIRREQRAMMSRFVDTDQSGPDWFLGPATFHWSYNCPKCGNKRCPHHTWHGFRCTNSNKPDQEGSIF